MTGNKRIYWIDNARAAAMVSMVIYHAMWDLVFLYGVRVPWFHSDVAFYWQQSICWTFIFLAGFCTCFTGSVLRQGLIVSFWGLVVTLVTLVVTPESRIIFGVLTLIGSCCLLMVLLKPFLWKVSPMVGFVVALFCFALTYRMADGYLGIFGLELIKLPSVLYSNLFTTYLGFPYTGFYSSDYFAIFPWVFLFLGGVFGGRLWSKYRPWVLERCNKRVPVLSWLGRHSLVVYVMHQPVIYGVLSLIFYE